MAIAEVRLEGVEELEKLMNQLPGKLRKKHLRRAIRRGVTLIRDDIKQTAPVREAGTAGRLRPRPGRLRRLVRIKARRPKRGYLKVSLFYPTEGDKNNPKNAFYWRFVVDGTKFMPGNDYITRSVDRNFTRVLARVISETNAGVRDELAKLRTAA